MLKQLSNKLNYFFFQIAMDSTGTYVATSSTDKTIYVYEYLTGHCVASMTGHSELVTGLKFMPSGKNLISVSGDGYDDFF